MRTKRKLTLGQLGIWVIIVTVTLWVIFPLYWAVITSFKIPADALRLSFIPFLQFQPTLANWQEELGLAGREIGRGMLNSFLIASGATLIACSLGTLAGYGLARFRYHPWQNKDMAIWFLSQRFLPPVATVIPFFLVMRSLNLLDTQIALILANATFTMPFAVLIMRDMFKELPEELEEAARVDGCSPLGAFWRVALPLASPALVAAAIIAFAFSWNEFLFALVLTFKEATPMTVIIAGVEHARGIQFWYVATRLLMAIIPPALLVLLVQRFIVRGLTFGAVKG